MTSTDELIRRYLPLEGDPHGYVSTSDDGKYHVIATPDDWAENPRETWKNLGAMRCVHHRYRLGDEPYPEDSRTVVINTADALLDDSERAEDLWYKLGTEGLLEWCEAHPDYYGYRLYLYDHSGISISIAGDTTPYNNHWDASCVGIIWAPRRTILGFFGRKRMSKNLAAAALRTLREEVEVYDTYLRGDIYRVAISGPDGDDAYGGIFGLENLKAGLADYDPSLAKNLSYTNDLFAYCA